jgi:hypothetical protein
MSCAKRAALYTNNLSRSRIGPRRGERYGESVPARLRTAAEQKSPNVTVVDRNPYSQVLRAPVHVMEGNYQRMDSICPWWDAAKVAG